MERVHYTSSGESFVGVILLETCREAAKEIGSSVPWVGFPVGYAVSDVLLTVFGYFAMIL